MSQIHRDEHQPITPSSGLKGSPLTHPPADIKTTYTQAAHVIKLIKDRAAGRFIEQQPGTELQLTEFQLASGEYEEILKQLSRDESLWEYVQTKLRINYDAKNHQLIIRMMHTLLHEFFLFQVVLAIENELQSIRNGSDGAALFAQDVKGAGSGEVSFPIDDVVSKHNPDASFWHKNARYPGVIVEVSYSHKRKIDRLAESYLLDSKGGVQVVVVLDIAYGKRRPRKATLSVWRSRIYDTVDGKELRVFQEVKNEAFRDDQGNPTSHSGLRLQLRDFANQKIAQAQIGDQDRELAISTQKLCQDLNEAEIRYQRYQQRTSRRRSSSNSDTIPPEVKIRKKSRTPFEEINSDDEAKYVEEEQRAEKYASDDDSDYQD